MKSEYVKMMERAADHILSLFFPRRCPVCQDIVQPKGALICPSCRQKISFVKEPCCRRCGKEIPDEISEYCHDCSHKERSFHEGISLMNYDNTARSSIQGFKYHGRQEYAAYYIEEILHRYGGRIGRWRADAVVPVPCDRIRQRIRGYNQAEILAKELASRLGIMLLPTILMRQKSSQAQKNLTGGQREKNLQKLVKAGELPSGVRRVILIDDIYTTGATAQACSKALLQAGVQDVYLITICIGRNN